MSLLMQALKKAEHAKQKQSGASAEKDNVRAQDDALSLSPKEIPTETADAGIGSLGRSEHAQPGSLLSALSLSPQSEERTAEFVATATDGESRPAAPPEDFARPQGEARDVAATPGVDKTAAGGTPDALKQIADRPDAVSTGPARAGLPRTGAEFKQAAGQAEQQISIERQKAKSVFSSKTPSRTRRNTLIAVVALTILVVQAGIGYFYWQSTRLDNNAIVAGVPRAAPAVPELPASATGLITAGASPPSNTDAAQASMPAAAADSSQVVRASITPPAAPITPKSAAATAPVTAGETKVLEAIAAAGAAPSPSSKPAEAAAKARKTARVSPVSPAPDSSAIRIIQSSSGEQVNPGLTTAYQFFISGDAASARQQYQKVLQQEPGNRDALLGMAAIALNQRQAAQAGSFYGKLLELDPTDPEAIAGLTSLQQGDPVQSESRLKKVLNQNPQAGAVLFALGNLYAQQSRWPDAQQAYFRAYTSAPANADYAFNLAVSLDRLNQPRLAQEYYRRALVLGQSGPGNFSRSSVEKRIRELDAPADD